MLPNVMKFQDRRNSLELYLLQDIFGFKHTSCRGFLAYSQLIYCSGLYRDYIQLRNEIHLVEHYIWCIYVR